MFTQYYLPKLKSHRDSEVRFFSPDANLDEDTQDAVKRKAAEMEAEFLTEREAFNAQRRAQTTMFFQSSFNITCE